MSINYISYLAEYRILEDKIPSYLSKKFDYVRESIFPSDISISLSLSRISGTLLYSIDKYGNQLILSLHDALKPILAIEFNSQKFQISLSKLCGCGRCLYRIFLLRIQLRNMMYVQCNHGVVEEFKISKEIKINEGYPIPIYRTQEGISSGNVGYLWLVNTPSHKNVDPNSDQLAGCIFQVLYNNQPITFSKVSENIESPCTRACTHNICHDGECYETYQARPICDCTDAFLNGDLCNRSKNFMKTQSISQYFTFEYLKLSWKSNATQLMKLKNRNLWIELKVKVQQLLLVFNYSLKVQIISICVLEENYEYDTESILLLYIEFQKIKIKFKQKGIWKEASLTTNRQLGNEIFEEIIFDSEPGVMDVVYKLSKLDSKWRDMTILKHTGSLLIRDEDNIDYKISENEKKKYSFGDAVTTHRIIQKTSEGSLRIRDGNNVDYTFSENERKKYLFGFIVAIIILVCCCTTLCVILRQTCKKVSRLTKLHDDHQKQQEVLMDNAEAVTEANI